MYPRTRVFGSCITCIDTIVHLHTSVYICTEMYTHVCRCTMGNQCDPRMHTYAYICIHLYTYVCICMPLNTCVYISVQMYNQIKCTRCTLCICIHMHTLMHRCIFTYVVRSKFLWQQELKLFFSTSTACTRCCSTSLFFAAGSVSSCARKPLTAATFSR